jgi:CubicO group peptidase (beta-lactamase class C family)
MMRFSRSTAVASLAAATLTVSAHAQNADAALGRAALESFIRGEMTKRHIPGLQVAVVRHGGLAYHGEFGLANVQDSVPVTRQTTFTINSITKAFVGVAIMQLVDAGKIDLAAPVSRYVDSLPESWRAVTIRQLLTHESGLPDIMNPNTGAIPGDNETAAWAAVQQMPLQSAPGVRFSYNQTNYLLLGKIIHSLSATSFPDFIAERQFRVVGMPRTAAAGFGDSHDVITHGARGYTFFRIEGQGLRTTDTLGNVFEQFPPSLRTAAGMSSTAEEMAKWIIAPSAEAVIEPGQPRHALDARAAERWQDRQLRRLTNGYALGWPTVDRSPHRAIAALGGARSALFIYPDDDLAVVVLTNLQGSQPERMLDPIASFFVPDIKNVVAKTP